MIAVFFGNNTVSVREAAFKYVQHISKNMATTTIDTSSFQSGMLKEVARGESLFGDIAVYVIDAPSAQKDFLSEVTDNLNLLAASPNRFVIIESTLLATDKKKFAKHADLMEEYTQASERSFNIFSLADAFARKDKKSLWLLLHDAYHAGIAPEELIGMLWWQLKTLRLAACTENAAEADMKDFPYAKAKRALTKFEVTELVQLSHTLLVLQRDARLGKRDIDLALEHWILTIS